MDGRIRPEGQSTSIIVLVIRAAKSKVKKWWKRGRRASLLVLAVLAIGLQSLYALHVMNMRKSIDPAAYEPLLSLIAKAESNGNYNAYFGHAENATIDFTSMSVAEVQNWQAEYIQQGSPSSAVGRYQIVNTTLSGLVQRLDIDTTGKFDQAMQDRLAIALLERRGAQEYIDQTMSREEFAHSLAKEWAALPQVVGDNPQESYYASDGINRSRVSVGEVLAVIDEVHKKAAS